MAKRKVLEEEQAVYPSNYPPGLLREVERWRAWHTPSLSSMPVFETARQVAEEKEYYEHDTIYRKQIGSLTARYDGKLKKAKRGNMKKIREAFDDDREDLLEEARLRRYLMSFDTMKKNYEARKKEFEKIDRAFK